MMVRSPDLEQDTTTLLLLHGGLEGRQDGLVKDVLKALLCQSRALDVLDSLELLDQLLTLLKGNGSLLVLGQLHTQKKRSNAS